MKNIGVIFGGNSVEHEISIITALQAIENIDKTKYRAVPVYIAKDGKIYSEHNLMDINNYKDLDKLINTAEEKILYKDGDQILLLPKKKSFFKKKEQLAIDAFFPIVHGTNVEDGKLQGYLETLQVPYIGPTTTSGVVGQNKAIMKDILKANNINQTKYIIVHEDDKDIEKRVKKEIGYPVIVKPANLGSSVGIFIAKSKADLENKIGQAFKYDAILVIEELLVDFAEMNISVRHNHDEITVSAIERVRANDELLSYEDKYLSQGSKGSKGAKTQEGGMASLQRELPAKITKKLQKEIEETAKLVYKTLYCEGIIRIDLMIVNDVVYVNEVNNIPGSLAFYLWEESGIKYKDLLSMEIEEGIRRSFKRKNKNFSFDTNVLAMQNGKLKK